MCCKLRKIRKNVRLFKNVPTHLTISHTINPVSGWILANYLTWRNDPPFPRPGLSSLLLFPQRSGPRWTRIFEWVQMKMSGHYCLLPQRWAAVNAENSVNNLLQFLASVGDSAGLCCSLIELAPDPRKDKTNKVTSRQSCAITLPHHLDRVCSQLHEIHFKQFKMRTLFLYIFVGFVLSFMLPTQRWHVQRIF